MSRITRKTNKESNRGIQPMSLEKDALFNILLQVLKTDNNLVVLASAQTTHAHPTPNNLITLLVREVAGEYPPRFFGLGQFMEDLVPTVTELVSEGLKPIILLDPADLARSYAGLLSVCAAHLPVTFVLISGIGTGQTWRPVGVNDLAVLLTLPSLSVAEPADSTELKQMLRIALSNENGPTALRYFPFNIEHIVVKPSLGPSLGAGKGQMLRQGKALGLIALGTTVETALNLATELHKHGQEAAVVEARWTRPLDEALLVAVGNHFRRVVTMEQGTLSGGFGAALLELFESRDCQHIAIHRMGLSYGTPADMPQMIADVKRFLDKTSLSEGINLPFSAQHRYILD